MNVRSALITTDESKMSGCRLKFTIDDGVEVVPDNGVGLDGVGGLFNMNVDTNTFRVQAADGPCSPFFALVEVQLYIYPVLTLHPSLAVPSLTTNGQMKLHDLDALSETDLLIPIQKGSYFRERSNSTTEESTGLLLIQGVGSSSMK